MKLVLIRSTNTVGILDVLMGAADDPGQGQGQGWVQCQATCRVSTSFVNYDAGCKRGSIVMTQVAVRSYAQHPPPVHSAPAPFGPRNLPGHVVTEHTSGSFRA